METKVLLDIGPFGLSESDRKAMRNACGSTPFVETFDEKSIENLDCSQFDVLVTENAPRNIKDFSRLRFVQLVSAGINHLKGSPLGETEIVVANASGTHSVPIAQYVTCALLMLAHRMPKLIPPLATQQWARAGQECVLLRGQTVGIIGYGSIGRECARQLSALGMRVLCLKRNPEHVRDEGFTAWEDTGDPMGTIPDRWFGPSQLREMLPQCDAVVLTVPCTEETLDMIGEPELALLKRHAVVVNVARGGIVNEMALAQALRNGQIGGAVIDCFTTEPIPADHAFFSTPNIVLTPHMAGVCDFFWPVMAQLLKENLQRFIEGQPVMNRVDFKHGY